MRTDNELERLAAAGTALLADAESFVDAKDEDRILARVLASGRAPARARRGVVRRPVRLAAGAAVLAAAIAVAATGVFDRSTPRASNHQLALKGAKLHLAGYRFRTPAGFKASSTACGPAHQPGQPMTVLDGLRAAASAEGGCVEASIMISMHGSAVPGGATPVDVGMYQGYVTAAGSSQGMTLYVVLPNADTGGDVNWQALVLDSQGLTQNQLVAVAESGLPQGPAAGATVRP